MLFGDDGRGLVLFPRCCGRSPTSPLVDGCDYKHVAKRFRMALKRAKGVRICEHSFTRRLLTRLLVDEGRCTTTEADTMFGIADEDAQNVAAVTKLLQSIASLEGKALADFPRHATSPVFASQLRELKVLAMYCRLLFEVVCSQTAANYGQHASYLSLSDLTVSAAKLALLLFVLFRNNNTSFVPAQHYHNTMIMLRAPYTSQLRHLNRLASINFSGIKIATIVWRTPLAIYGLLHMAQMWMLVSSRLVPLLS